MKKTGVLIMFSLFMAAIGMGFLVGINYQKKIDLWQCKLAGWDFIEEVVLDRKFAENHPRGKKYGIGLLMDLQANIATKCIVRIK